MPHFYSSDLVGVAIASLLGIPLILLPGYGLGWWLDLFDFRSLHPATRWSLAPGFGLTLAPILLYLPFRLSSVYVTWGVVALLCGTGFTACANRNSIPAWKAIPRSAILAILIWTVLCVSLMLDIAVGPRLYPSTVIVDTSFRSEVITAIADSHTLPAVSYFFFPGHSTTLRYHYIYFLVSALMVQGGHGFVSAAMALVALSLWTGFAFLGVVSAFVRFFWGPENPDRVRNIAWGLLVVGGLDLMFAGTQMIQRWHNEQFIFTGPDIGLWNGWGSTFSWLSTTLFSPHHLGGLMAGVLACILLWHSRSANGSKRWISAIAAGLMLATLGGTSLYVGAMFAIFLFLVVIELFLNAPRYVIPVATAGVIAVVLIAPFFFDVRPPGSASAGSFFNFQVRGFLPVTLLFPALGIESKLAWNLGYLFSLPINYLCEFGVFFVAGIWWLRERRKHPPEDLFRDHLIIGLMAISIIIPSIAWSGMEISNDLGFRGVLPAQFLLLFCASDLLSRSRSREDSSASRRVMQIAIVFLAIGIGSTFLEMITLRGAMGTTAKQTIMTGEMFRTDISAERLAELRDAYTWIRRNTPQNAAVQENPTTWQMVPFGQYSERRTVVYGSNPNYLVGEDHREYLDTVTRVEALYATGTPWQAVVDACARFSLSYIVVQDGDDAWIDHGSYVWLEKPVFANQMVRVFRCDSDITH